MTEINRCESCGWKLSDDQLLSIRKTALYNCKMNDGDIICENAFLRGGCTEEMLYECIKEIDSIMKEEK